MSLYIACETMYYLNKNQESILNLIEKFGCIKKSQILKITKMNEKKLQKSLDLLIQKKYILHKDVEDTIYLAPLQEIDCKILKCLDVICYLSNKIEHCEREEFPFDFWIYYDNQDYDITYITEGEENLYCTTIKRCDNVDRIIVIIDNIEQISKLKIDKQSVQYCTLDPIKFYEIEKKPKEGDLH